MSSVSGGGGKKKAVIVHRAAEPDSMFPFGTVLFVIGLMVGLGILDYLLR